jgi:hypothetical protein
MSDSQIAKVILALNNLTAARNMLTGAVTEGGALSNRIAAINEKIKICEEELRNIQFNK